jgi:hypothetical protein
MPMGLKQSGSKLAVKIYDLGRDDKWSVIYQNEEYDYLAVNGRKI